MPNEYYIIAHRNYEVLERETLALAKTAIDDLVWEGKYRREDLDIYVRALEFGEGYYG